jgi:penicillin-binding protein 1C
MQVIRMARDNPPRTLLEKCLEMCMATRLELGYSKRSILRLYAAHAPFGGNVVGLEAAAWRYYGKKPELLSWAEAATLAVLPNSPALIHPGRNRQALLDKRNRLLEKLRDQGKINAITCELAQEEPLPDQPLPLPMLAPHLLERLLQNSALNGRSEHRFFSTIDRNLQQRVMDVLERRQAVYKENDVHNMAAVVLDIRTGAVLAYVGNVIGAGKEHGESVDILKAPRSTGSILKPYLYALALESGDILPASLLEDVPTQLGDYKPENYYENYDGAVPAKRALIRSLNVPFVLLLQKYGLEKFHFNLKRLGLSTLIFPPSHYGLSLILGGAEANLLDITNTYACMARSLGNFYSRNGRYDAHDFRPPEFLASNRPPKPAPSVSSDLLQAGAIWYTFEAMQQVERPSSSGEWELFSANKRIAWKTGTSIGFRDAWAAGVTPSYAVGVWVGNADGEGRPGLIGVEKAAPVLFEIFEQLPGGDTWFDPPYDAMEQAAVCRQSGYRAGNYCTSDTLWIPKGGLNAPVCPFHQLLHLDASGQFQVSSDCAAASEMQHVPWFVLPPMQEYFYKSKNPNYVSPPPFRPDCIASAASQDHNPMQFIYPKYDTKIYVPVDLNGKLGSTVFKAAHRKSETLVYWHLDGSYLGSTQTFHEMALQPSVGKHVITLVDKDGYRLEQAFEIIGKN